MVDKRDWLVKIITFRANANEVAIQYPDQKHNPSGRRQAAKVLFQHACDNCLIYTEEFEPGVVGIFVYKKDEEIIDDEQGE